MNTITLKEGDMLEIHNGWIYVNLVLVGTISNTGIVLSLKGRY